MTKTIKTESFNFHYKKNRSFNTSDVVISFKIPLKDEYKLHVEFLTQYFDKTKKYNTNKKYYDKKSELYFSKIGINYIEYFDMLYFRISITSLGLKHLNNEIYKEVLDFYIEVINNVILDSDEDFRKYKKLLLNDVMDKPNNPAWLFKYKFFKLIGNNYYFLYDNLKEIKKTKKEDIISFYKEILDNSEKEIFAFGDIDENLILETMKSNFKTKNSKYKVNRKLELLKNHELITKIDKSNFKKSTIGFEYKVDDFKYEERYLFILIDRLLDSTASKILKEIVRDKYGLTYSTSSSFSYLYGDLIITAGINPKTFDDTVKAVEEVFEYLKKSDLKPYINNIINYMKKEELYSSDSKRSQIIEMVLEKLKIEDKNEIKNFESITESDIKNSLDRIKLSVIYMNEGESVE